jgi:hypothetical protein
MWVLVTWMHRIFTAFDRAHAAHDGMTANAAGNEPSRLLHIKAIRTQITNAEYLSRRCWCFCHLNVPPLCTASPTVNRMYPERLRGPSTVTWSADSQRARGGGLKEHCSRKGITRRDNGLHVTMHFDAAYCRFVLVPTVSQELEVAVLAPLCTCSDSPYVNRVPASRNAKSVCQSTEAVRKAHLVINLGPSLCPPLRCPHRPRGTGPAIEKGDYVVFYELYCAAI